MNRSSVDFPNPDNLRIVVYPEPVLKKACAPVDQFGPAIRALADRMFALMKEAKGVGLAAPQLGVPVRLFVCNPTGEPNDDCVYVNPVLSDLTGAVEESEGCLSIPDVSVNMRRATGATIDAMDAEGKPFRTNGERVIARIWQHETDHLEGRLIIDNMSATDQIANRRVLKELVADYDASKRRKKPSRCESSS